MVVCIYNEIEAFDSKKTSQNDEILTEVIWQNASLFDYFLFKSYYE